MDQGKTEGNLEEKAKAYKSREKLREYFKNPITKGFLAAGAIALIGVSAFFHNRGFQRGMQNNLKGMQEYIRLTAERDSLREERTDYLEEITNMEKEHAADVNNLNTKFGETNTKYMSVLEQNNQLNTASDALTKQLETAKGKNKEIVAELTKSAKELTQVNKKHTTTLEEYTAVLKQKERWNEEQKKLTSQLEDLTEKHEGLTEENTKLTKNYASAMEQGKQLEQKLEEAGKKYDALDKQAVQLLDEKEKIEKDRIEMMEKYNQVLEAYNKLIKHPVKPSVRGQVKGEIIVNKDENDLVLHQVNSFRSTYGLDIVFMKGTKVDKAETDVFERTDKYSDRELRDQMLAGRAHGFLVDYSGDGIADLVYEGARDGKDKLKAGRKDGSFAPAEIISNESTREVFKKYILRGLGF